VERAGGFELNFEKKMRRRDLSLTIEKGGEGFSNLK
jgi:hypothetical protein